ncbi:hypothetical protein RQ479_22320 [Mesorhizobium sp. ISC25]|uniref:hypothetical protein n=1 Tax=Mesorhizobium sp. ISC25 TaxID=3077335 RepID=UPI0035DBD784
MEPVSCPRWLFSRTWLSPKATDYDPASLDLAALIKCRADVSTYAGFALWLSDRPDAPAKLGWKDVPAGNPFLKQYEIAGPASRVRARNGIRRPYRDRADSGVDDVSAPDLARELGVTAQISTPEKFLGEKIVVESSEEADGMTFSTRIALNVSTVKSHPGKVLAGCSYALDVK